MMVFLAGEARDWASPVFVVNLDIPFSQSSEAKL